MNKVGEIEKIGPLSTLTNKETEKFKMLNLKFKSIDNQ